MILGWAFFRFWPSEREKPNRWNLEFHHTHEMKHGTPTENNNNSQFERDLLITFFCERQLVFDYHNHWILALRICDMRYTIHISNECKCIHWLSMKNKMNSYGFLKAEHMAMMFNRVLFVNQKLVLYRIQTPNSISV